MPTAKLLVNQHQSLPEKNDKYTAAPLDVSKDADPRTSKL